ncbi:hypothetical protein MMC19_003519 [Ptychographa xylographoides]|nr:hypothetical protein [Ptychographa xylographoides]
MGRISRQRAVKDARIKLGKAQPLETFFASFTDFAFNPEAPSGVEFRRLCKNQGWKRGDEAQDIAWREFRMARILEFNAQFGTLPKDLLVWQTLCTVVGIEEANQATDWETCEKASPMADPRFEQPSTGQQRYSNAYLQLLKSRHFSLADAVDVRRRGQVEPIPTFASEEALLQHINRTAAYFPRWHVAAGSLLKRVLKRVPLTEKVDTMKE